MNRLCPTFDLRQRRSERLPALARHHQIEQHEIDRIALEHAAHGSTVRGIAHPQAFADEVASQHGADARLVVDDQDVHRLTHSRSAISLVGGKSDHVQAVTKRHVSPRFDIKSDAFRHQPVTWRL